MWYVTSQRHFKQGLPVRDGRMRVWAEDVTCAKALGLERLSWSDSGVTA